MSLADITAMKALKLAKNQVLQISKQIGNNTSSVLINNIQMYPIGISRMTQVSRVSGSVSVTEPGKMVEIAIYDATFKQMVTTDPREIPAVGNFEMAFPTVILQPGLYYLVFVSNATSGTFGYDSTLISYTTTRTLPLPTTISTTVTQGTGFPALNLMGQNVYSTLNFAANYSENNDVKVYGINTSNSNPWGVRTSTSKMCYSTDSGATFIDVMLAPTSAQLGGVGIQDLLVYNNANIFLLTSAGNILKSSDLTSSATWANVSCPTTTGLRHPTATGRPYGIATFNGYLYQGEYSNSTAGEFAPDGPRVLKLNISSGVWALSKEFTNSRHIHSLFTNGSSTLYVAIGDTGNYGDGSDVGIHRMTNTDIGTGANGTDTWTKWNSVASPNTDFYPVDFITQTGVTGAPDGIYGTADTLGRQMLYCKTTGNPGQFNFNSQIFGNKDEGSRSIIADSNKNLYFWTAPNALEQALYMSPPPYTQSIKLKDFSTYPQLSIYRSILSGTHILMGNQRFSVITPVFGN